MKRSLLSTTLLTLILLTAGTRYPSASELGAETNPTLDPTTRTLVLQGVLKRLNETYVYPETATAMERSILDRTERGEYERIESPEAFADTLTAHLRAVSHDNHVQVHYSPEPLPPMGEDPHPETAEERESSRRDQAWVNNGFLKLERLKGNIGFLDLDSFVDPSIGGETAIAAMAFLANCEALIVDLRYNPGGNARMATLLLSYLFDSEPVHLMDIYSRPEDFTLQTWSASYVPGRRLADKDVYVLTSQRTHSAAEHFCYVLQSLKRGTIIGEITRGGAHPTGRYRITEHFGVAVPEARAISPITGTNWEGKGIQPDIAVPADEALTVAHRTALERLFEKSAGSERANDYRRALDKLAAAESLPPHQR